MYTEQKSDNIFDIKIAYWNIEGLLNKTQFKDFIKFIEYYDIFAFSETWEISNTETSNILSSHKCFFLPAAKHADYGRGMAGMSVYVNKKIVNFIEPIYLESELGIAFKFLKNYTGFVKDVILYFLYLPPADSPFYTFKTARGLRLFEQDLDYFCSEQADSDLVILGDLNARCGELSECIPTSRNTQLEEYNDFFVNPVNENRYSCDKTVNSAGRMLIDICKVFSLYILNGRSGHDNGIGNYTYVSTLGSSVIDYCLCTGDVTEHIKEFRVEERGESQHFPISLILKLNHTDNNTCTTVNLQSEQALPHTIQ